MSSLAFAGAIEILNQEIITRWVGGHGHQGTQIEFGRLLQAWQSAFDTHAFLGDITHLIGQVPPLERLQLCSPREL